MPDRKKPADHVSDLKGLVVGYAKQETIDPLRSLGRYLSFGAAGSVLIGAGVAYLLLGMLRGLQTVHLFNDPARVAGGNLSFLPYLFTAIAGIIVVVALAVAIRRDMKKGK